MRSSHTARTVLVPGLVALVAVLGACSEDNEATSCQTNAQCPEGQYCGSAGLCTLDCRKDTDCPGGICSSLGKCVGGTTNKDGGAGDLDAGGDATGGDGTPDAPVADQYVSPDIYAKPDRSVIVDLPVKPDTFKKPDMAVTDLPIPDAWPYDALPPDKGQVVVVPGTYKKLQAGTFSMGSPSTETCRNAINEFQHQVTLTRGIAISTTETTQALFYQLMGYNPSKNSSCGGGCPAEGVSWHEAAAYCNALSKKASLTACYTCTGSGSSMSCTPNVSSGDAGSGGFSTIVKCPGFRLPTEAEWEYAARAGTTTPLYNGNITTCTGLDINANAIAWYKGNATSIMTAALKTANTWGLYDMAGNVLEWTNDWYTANLGTAAVTDPVGPASGTDRVVKGGSWNYGPNFLRHAYRVGATPTLQINNIGFRCVRTLPAAPVPQG